MKKFKFSLESLLRYRVLQADQEQARLQSLQYEMRVLEDQKTRLAGELDQSRLRLRLLAVVPVEELTALQGFRRFVEVETKRIEEVQAGVQKRIEEQLKVLQEARRRVEGLDQLKEKRLENWKKEADNELEQTVSELVISRFKRSSSFASET